jgi:hypothetical protein
MYVIKIYNNQTSTFEIMNRFYATTNTISETYILNTAKEYFFRIIFLFSGL